jgi:hypothetical protein
MVPVAGEACPASFGEVAVGEKEASFLQAVGGITADLDSDWVAAVGDSVEPGVVDTADSFAQQIRT